MTTAHMPKGYIIISRELLDHPVVGLASGHTAHWLDLLARASHEDGYNGLMRGELSATRRTLAQDWGLSDKQARCFLDKLQAHNMLVLTPRIGAKSQPKKGQTNGQKSGRPPSVYLVVNYDKYQSASTDRAMLRAEERAKTPPKKGPPRIHLEDSRPNGLVVPVPGNDPSEPILPCVAEADQTNQITVQVAAPDAEPETSPETQAIEVWNAMARSSGLPTCAKLSEDRRRKLRARLKEHGVAEWEQAVRQVPKSKFLLGREGARSWKANIDFMVRPGTLTKIIEGGNYGLPVAPPARTNATETRTFGTVLPPNIPTWDLTPDECVD